MTSKIEKFISDDLVRIYPEVAAKLTNAFNKVFFITGGAGFLGFWLCEWLMFLNKTENANIKVYILDRDVDKFKERFSANIASGSIQVFNSDIRGLTEIPPEVNFIIHAAATPDTRYHVSYPSDTMMSIAEGTSAVLNAARRLEHLELIINVSASAVYANSEQEPVEESADLISFNNSISTIYAEAKRYSEKLCMAAKNEYRLPVVNVRPFTFCGPYHELSSPWLLNTFINDAVNHRNIKIYGDGSTIRGVMYGADFAIWLLVILLNSKSGEVYNIGSDEEITAAAIAAQVAVNFSPKPDIMLNTALAKINDRTYLVPKVDKVLENFGLAIYTSTEQCINRTVAWFKSIQE